MYKIVIVYGSLDYYKWLLGVTTYPEKYKAVYVRNKAS